MTKTRPREHGRTLLVSTQTPALYTLEAWLLRCLEMAGRRPMVLLNRRPAAGEAIEPAGAAESFFWRDFLPASADGEADELLARTDGFQRLIRSRRHGAAVGRYTAATALRYLRQGSIDLSDRRQREAVRPYLARSLAYAGQAGRLLDAARPELVVSSDLGYTPRGELFDACLARGIPTVTWNLGPTGDTLLLKRYGRENRHVHPASLSADSWALMRGMAWSAGQGTEVRRRLEEAYASGDWFAEAGTQFHKQRLEAAEVKRRLGLDPSRRTAVIFAHILWDGTFFYGRDVFSNYEEWLAETARAAAANPRLDWIVKIHPANLAKNVREGVAGRPGEEAVLERVLGRLPGHVVVMKAESDISTFSLFRAMDFCVTVRGTVGIEAAAFGVPALTAGTGRYDRLGFTEDSASRAGYLRRLRRLPDLPPLDPARRELAERYAHGAFHLRLLPLSSLRVTIARDAAASMTTEMPRLSDADLAAAPDARALAGWLNSGAEDFLRCPAASGGEP